jgi:hypothetical protein
MTRALHLVVPALLLLSAACTTNGGNTFLVATKVIYATGTAGPGGTCLNATLTPSTGEALFPTYATSTPSAMLLGLVVDNRLSSTVASDNRKQSNDWTAEKGIVSYEGVGSGAINLPERSLPVQGYVPAGTIGAVLTTIISKEDVALLQATQPTFRVKVHLTGKLNDGSTVQTSDYEFIATPGSGANCTTK